MRTHDQVVAKLMRRPGVRKEVERIERDEGVLLDLLLKARHDAGLTQAQVAERMGTQPPAVARLERALATGKHSAPGERKLAFGDYTISAYGVSAWKSFKTNIAACKASKIVVNC
jgi:transcriptional regulator with XRE-family HTH domain